MPGSGQRRGHVLQAKHSDKFARLGNLLGRAATALAATALFALMVMTFSDVVMRSVLNSPIEAATELTRLFMAIIVFSSLPVISWRGKHITVDLMDPLVSPALARLRDVAINVACGIALCWPAWRVWQLAGRARNNGDVTEYLQLPQFYVAYFIAVSSLITAAVLVLRGVVIAAAPHRLQDPDREDVPHG